MSCTACPGRPLPCSNNRTCGEFRLNQVRDYSNVGSLTGGNGSYYGAQRNSNGPRNIDVGGVIVKYASTPGQRYSCPPCGDEPCGCPTMSYCPRPDRCDSSPLYGSSPCYSEIPKANFCCPDPCRPRMKPCQNLPCCRPFPTFPKVCCPCCWRPDPGMRKKCFYPQPICPPPMCSKLCLIPKHCSSSGVCCPPMPVCPNCPPYTYPKGNSCAQEVPVNPPLCKKPIYSGCPSVCCPRPPFGLVPCDGTKCQDNYCCPKPICIAIDCPFRAFPSTRKYH